MSNSTRTPEQECSYLEGCSATELIIQSRVKDLGGFSVRRLLPTTERKMVGPWIFFDHMGPANFPAGQGVNVRPHPHVNIATVTYLFEGEILHRDSVGSYQPIRPGDLNLMVCGRGIVHSERERDEVNSVPHSLHGLQLWMALPERDEEVDPSFHHYPEASIPTAIVGDVPIRVMIGQAYGLTSPVKTFAETLYVEAHLQPGQSLVLPEAQERAVYVAGGRVQALDTQLPEHSMTVFKPEAKVVLEATRESRIAIIGGEKFNKRFIEWNFVSSRKERIEQAKQDWKNRNFPLVMGDEEEFIPFPE